MNTHVRRTPEEAPFSTPAYALYPAPCIAPMLPLNQLVLLQNQVLQQVATQSHEIAHLIRRIESCVQGSGRCSSQASTASSEGKTVSETYTLKLVLDGELATPVLKERGFSLTGAVRDTEDQVAVQAAGMQITLALYSQDNLSRALTLNIAGQF